jgi:hypothetical protein
MKYLMIAAIAVLMSACTETKPINPDLAKMGQVTYARPVQGVPATAVFVRDIGFAGMGTTAYLYVDGEPAAQLETSEKAVIDLTAGEHGFGVEMAPRTGQARASITERLEPGQSYLYRIGQDVNGILIQRTK